MHNKSLTATKKNLVKKKFPFIDTFNNTGLTVVRVMHDLTVRLFEHQETTSPTDSDQRIAYTEWIIRGAALNKYKIILEECNDSVKEIAGDHRKIGPTKDLTMVQLWSLVKTHANSWSWDMYLVRNRCIDLGREIRFELGNSMCKRHSSIYQCYVKYTHNDIMKPFRVGILRYSEHVCEMHDLTKILAPNFNERSRVWVSWVGCPWQRI